MNIKSILTRPDGSDGAGVESEGSRIRGLFQSTGSRRPKPTHVNSLFIISPSLLDVHSFIPLLGGSLVGLVERPLGDSIQIPHPFSALTTPVLYTQESG